MKLAICLHGLVGNIVGKSGDSNVGSEQVLDLSYQHWEQYFLTPYNPDIFIHSWNVDLKDKMVELFQPKKIIVEPQKVFEIPEWIPGGEKRKQGHYSKWYSNLQSVNLMLDSQNTYDLVMIARFDIAWKKAIAIHKLNPEIFYIGGWFRNPSSKVKDFWFVSNPKYIKKFSKLYSKIEEYCSPEVNAISKSNGISNHKMAAHHLVELDLPIEQLLQCNDDYDPKKSDYPLIRYEYFGVKK